MAPEEREDAAHEMVSQGFASTLDLYCKFIGRIVLIIS